MDALFPPGEAEWRRLPPQAAVTRTIAGAATGLIIGTVVAFGATVDREGVGWRLAAVLAGAVAGPVLGAWIGRARWRRTRWKLDDRGFFVRRGWLFRAEVMVPRSRVQHLDIERGPLERQFGLASIVVHTAGSQTPALRQSGLADADAISLRDALIPDANRNGDAL